MSRPLRIEFPNAWYHIMNRGRRSEPVFLQNKDYLMFLELLKQSNELWNINIAAYCLMTSHYHLLIQTPDANISRVMRHINSIYTQRFNKSHGYDGPLFRGRYKSVLVCDDSHLLELVRYIHKNPVKASMVNEMADYKWSSYKGYISYSKTWNWLSKDTVFSMLTRKKKGRLKPFIEFMEKDDSEKIKHFFSLKQLPSLFGPESFITKIKEEFYFKKKSQEIPESKQLAPEPDTIINEVSRYYGVSIEDMYKTKRGWFNKPRNVAIYLIRMLCAKKLTTIAELFHMNTYGAVSSVIQRVGLLRKKDKKIRKDLDSIVNIINKAQRETPLF
jgi:putative transposase